MVKIISLPVVFRQGMAGISRNLGQDVPGDQKVFMQESFGLIFVPQNHGTKNPTNINHFSGLSQEWVDVDHKCIGAAPLQNEIALKSFFDSQTKLGMKNAPKRPR